MYHNGGTDFNDLKDRVLQYVLNITLFSLHSAIEPVVYRQDCVSKYSGDWKHEYDRQCHVKASSQDAIFQ